MREKNSPFRRGRVEPQTNATDQPEGVYTAESDEVPASEQHEPSQLEVAKFQDPGLPEKLAQLPPGRYHLSLHSPEVTRSLLKPGQDGLYVMDRVTPNMIQTAAYAMGWSGRKKLRRKNLSATVYIYAINDPSVQDKLIGAAGGSENIQWSTLQKAARGDGRIPRIKAEAVLQIENVTPNDATRSLIMMRRLGMGKF